MSWDRGDRDLDIRPTFFFRGWFKENVGLRGPIAPHSDFFHRMPHEFKVQHGLEDVNDANDVTLPIIIDDGFQRISAELMMMKVSPSLFQPTLVGCPFNNAVYSTVQYNFEGLSEIEEISSELANMIYTTMYQLVMYIYTGWTVANITITPQIMEQQRLVIESFVFYDIISDATNQNWRPGDEETHEQEDLAVAGKTLLKGEIVNVAILEGTHGSTCIGTLQLRNAVATIGFAEPLQLDVSHNYLITYTRGGNLPIKFSLFRQ